MGPGSDEISLTFYFQFFKSSTFMKNRLYLFFCLFTLILVTHSCNSNTNSNETDENQPVAAVEPITPVDNQLTEAEIAEGWQLLFDGKSVDKWRIFKRDTLAGWAVNDGELIALGEAGLEGAGADIITKEQFENFELTVDWKVSEAGNSGIFFNVVESEDYKSVYETGPEYQLIDDIGFPQALEDWQKSGANYAMHPASKPMSNPAGEYNTSKLTVDQGHVTHFLNGEKIVEYDLWTPEWENKVKEGKWKDFPGYGRAKKGHIALQDHGNQIWFKNIKIKVL